ncbi:MAG: hypothetical protein HY754_10830 [Nitrospirae bacterium]|nr:hypothetical protein [Nitrospirota bacterium]
MGLQAEQGIYAIFLLISIPVLIALFFMIRSVYRHTIGEKLKTTLIQDYKREAEAYERSCKFVSAANVYENKLKDNEKAAALYERGGDCRKAALLYDLLGMPEKAKEMYEKDRDLEKSAEISIREGDYTEAAKLYDKAGKKVDAAMLLEKSGRRLAAVKTYREAGEYRRAAKLLEEEGMIKEATEMFGLSLHNQKPGPTKVDDFYTYATMLEKIGDKQKALDIFSTIERFDPSFRDVKEKVRNFTPIPKEPEVRQTEDKLPEGKTSLRGIIRNGRIEPKLSLKLWVQILKSLQDAYKNGRAYGLLTPDNVVVDSRNNISFLDKPLSSAYVPPEIMKGDDPDVTADIYSSGVILYEMLTGDLTGLGSVRVADIVEDIPDWLDEIVIKCIKKGKEDRYRSIDEIFADLKSLSRGKKD